MDTAKEGWISTSTGASMLDGLDGRALTQKPCALILLHTRLTAILGSVPLAAAVDALNISERGRVEVGARERSRILRGNDLRLLAVLGGVQDLRQARVAQTVS